jgi:hypothetical protein
VVINEKVLYTVAKIDNEYLIVAEKRIPELELHSKKKFK